MTNLVLSDETSISPSEVFMDGTSITEIQLAEDCRLLVEELHATGNPQPIEQAITNLNGVEVFAAKAKSKLISEYYKWYTETKIGNDFDNYYVQKFGGEKLTVQKHRAIGELLMDEEVPEEVKTLPNKELISVARARQSGYDLSESWDEIQTAGSEAEVNEIVRKVKGKEPRSGMLTIKVYHDGSIMGFMGNVIVNLGWLNYQDRDDSDDEEKKKVLTMGISRIINNTRMKSE